jgi:hypothetical protein
MGIKHGPMVNLRKMRLKVISDGTVGGTQVLDENDEPIENVTSVVWKLDAKTGVSTCHITLWEQPIEADAVEGYVLSENEVSEGWGRYQIRSVNINDQTLHVSDMQDGMRKTIWISDSSWANEAWDRLKPGQTVKMKPTVDDEGDLIVDTFIEV